MKQSTIEVNEKMKAFAKAFNSSSNLTIADVAKALGISCKSVRNRAGEYRRAVALGASLEPLVDRGPGWTRPAVPLSEHEEKFQDWNEEQCIKELLRVQSLNDEVEVTRNYFRNNSTIADSTWSRHFGTFEEFKRQAGLKLSRQQHAVERSIAKHVSVDHYRKLTVERADWGDKYLRDNSNRFKTVLVCSDLHDIEIDPFYLRVLIDTARRAQPDVISLVGDVFDLPEFGKYSVDPREWNVVGRIKFAHENILKPLREACPDAQIDFIEGNHECVRVDTEILTEGGWKTAESIVSGDKVASYTLDGKSVRYDEPVAVKRINDAKLLNVVGDLSNEVVSNTHRIDIDGALSPAINFVGESINQRRIRYSIDVDKSGVMLTDDEVALLTWVVCDGTIVSRTECNKRVQFKLSRQDKIDNLQALLDKMGFQFTLRKATVSGLNRLQPYYICLYGDEARWVFEQLEGVKKFPSSFANLNKSQVTSLVDTLLKTDGSKRFNRTSLRTTSEEDANLLQLLFVQSGIPCKIKTLKNASGFKNGKTQYLLSIFDSGVSDRRKVRVSEFGTGDVIAIQTVNGTLITRNEGKVSFTGNCRLLRQLADATPALRAVLSDLHGFTVSRLLGLERFEINYVAKADLAAWTKRDFEKELANNYKVYWGAVVCHHFPHARNMGLPGVNGHHHRHEVWSMFSPIYGPYEWHQLGAGHVRSASYCEGEQWHNGFALINVDTVSKSTSFDYIAVTDFAVSGGKWYVRNEDERNASVPKTLLYSSF